MQEENRLLADIYDHSLKVLGKPYEERLFSNPNCEYYDTNDQEVNNPYA